MDLQREWFEKDYYKVLGIAENASDRDVTKAYRKLAKKLHPDANPGDDSASDRFKEVSAAYDVLGDEQKRKSYDEVRRLGPMAAGFGPGGPGRAGGPGGAGGFTGNVEDLGDLGNIFGNLFGRGRHRAGGRRGADLETELHLDFSDAVSGTTTTVCVVGEAQCRTCKGTGTKADRNASVAPHVPAAACRKKTRDCSRSAGICSSCSGSGSLIDDPCESCSGRGSEHRRREVKARIAAGMVDGQRIKLAGRGAPGADGGAAGDLYVRVHVKPHRLFGREGKNLTLTVPVTFAEAALGADVRVPTLDGSTVTIRVSAGTTSGKRLRIPASASTGGADLIARVEIVVPDRLSDEQRAAVETFAAAPGEDPRANWEQQR